MPALQFFSQAFTAELETGFAAIRRELDVPPGFPQAVLDEAAEVAERGPQLPPGAMAVVRDRTELPLCTIDPPDSIDLDQAFHAERLGDGYRVWYAIADVAAFVAPGGAMDRESLLRGVTRYSPDLRTSLHPEAINESAASLLPDQIRQAVLWRIDLDEDGTQRAAHAERALVRSRRKLSYAAAQERIDHDPDDEPLQLLRIIGERRQELEAARGAISLQLPAQEISTTEQGSYELHYDTSLPIEGWNAQISLLTGMAAAEIMIAEGHGLLRTLPPLDERTVKEVRRAAVALEIDWPDDVDYPTRMRQLDPNIAAEAALLTRAARSFRGAGYEAFFDHDVPEQPLHGAIAARYSHVTAPLRRVCDRYANEIVLAACAEHAAPEWALEGLSELPSIMGVSRQADRALERATVDFVEAMVLRGRVGEQFVGCVLSHRRNGASVQLKEPAVLAGVDSQPAIGSIVGLELTEVDPDRRKVRFAVRN